MKRLGKTHTRGFASSSRRGTRPGSRSYRDDDGFNLGQWVQNTRARGRREIFLKNALVGLNHYLAGPGTRDNPREPASFGRVARLHRPSPSDDDGPILDDQTSAISSTSAT